MNFDLIKKYLLLLSGVGLLLGCIGEADIPYPTYPEKYVLNGILNPDSIISVTLRKTLPPLANSNGYATVENATILCYQDGQRLGALTHRKNGRYELLETQPEAGSIYRIEAVVEGLMLSATDTVPVNLLYKIGGVPYEITSPYKNPDINLTFPELTHTTKYVWLSFTSKLSERVPGDTTRYFKDIYGTVASISPYLDDFNASRRDNDLLNVYNYMARIKPSTLGQGAVVFSPLSYTGAYNQPGTRLTLHVSSLSQAYDRYLKTAITAINNRFVTTDGALNNPFYEPTNVYSNVQNGLGILGAVNNRQRILIQN